MSITPRRLRPGGQVTVHVGLLNRGTRPIRPLVRVTVFDPEGTGTRLFNRHVAVFPNYREDDDHLARQRRMTSVYCVHVVSPDAPLGCYRVRVENFVEGMLQYSETVENDFFFVEDLEVDSVERSSDGGVAAWVRNRSPEPVPARLFEPDPAQPRCFLERGVEFPADAVHRIETTGSVAFLSYAGCEVTAISPGDGTFCLRNQAFFARREDDDTMFVLDPRAERKRNLFLTGRAPGLWHAAGGFNPRIEIRTPETADVYDAMVEAEILLELDRDGVVRRSR